MMKIPLGENDGDNIIVNIIIFIVAIALASIVLMGLITYVSSLKY